MLIGRLTHEIRAGLCHTGCAVTVLVTRLVILVRPVSIRGHEIKKFKLSFESTKHFAYKLRIQIEHCYQWPPNRLIA